MIRQREKWENMQQRVENEISAFVILTVSILGYEKIKEGAEMELVEGHGMKRQGGQTNIVLWSLEMPRTVVSTWVTRNTVS